MELSKTQSQALMEAPMLLAEATGDLKYIMEA